MNDYIKVKDNPSLVRDKNSNAVLNVDNAALHKYKMERDKILAEKRKEQNLINDVAQNKKDIQDIKQMLQQLMETIKCQ